MLAASCTQAALLASLLFNRVTVETSPVSSTVNLEMAQRLGALKSWVS